MNNLLQKEFGAYGRKGLDPQLVRQVKSGKEATIYTVTVDGELWALKLYTNPEHRSFKNIHPYIAGKYYRRPSERKAVRRKNLFGKKLQHTAWVRREYYLLEKLLDANVRVPQVLEFGPNSIIMEFIGSNGIAAPRLVDIMLTKDEAQRSFAELTKAVETMLDLGIIHGDLSAFNILWWKSHPYIIDIPQGVDISRNPNRKKMLERDIDNLAEYFKQYFAIDKKLLYSHFQLKKK